MDIYGLEFEIDKVCGFFDVFFVHNTKFSL